MVVVILVNINIFVKKILVLNFIRLKKLNILFIKILFMFEELIYKSVRMS